MPQQHRVLCCLCVKNGRGLWALLGSGTLDGDQVLKTSQARPQSFPRPTWFREPHTPTQEPSTRTQVGVRFVSYFNTWGDSRAGYEKIPRMLGTSGVGSWPRTSKVAFAVGWALQSAGSLVSPHPCSRQPNIRPSHDRGLCEAHTAFALEGL